MIKFFHDIVKQVHDFLFDHFEDWLVKSSEYIEKYSMMEDDLEYERDICFLEEKKCLLLRMRAGSWSRGCKTILLDRWRR